MGNGPIGIVTVLLIVLLVWFLAGGRPFRHAGGDLRTTVHDAGQDLRSSGRDVADSIRHDTQ